MCDYCVKFTPKAHDLKSGYEIYNGYYGEVFIDFSNHLVTHIEAENSNESIEISLPIKYCPWCGRPLQNVEHEVIIKNYLDKKVTN